MLCILSPPLLDEIYAPARIRSTNRFVKKNVGGVQYKPRGDWFSFATVRKLYFLCSCKQTRETSISHRRMLYVLHQGWGTLILEGHSPAEFSSNPEKPWKKIPNCILKTLISCFRCVWLGLEINSAGTPALRDQRSPPLSYIIHPERLARTTVSGSERKMFITF